MRLAISMAVLAALLVSAPARADDLTAPAPEAPAKTPGLQESKALYAEASAAYELGHFAQALAKFEAVYTARRVPGLLFNIAQCHRQLKHFEEAAVTYRSFIRADPSSPQVPMAEKLIDQMEQALQAQRAAQVAPPIDLNGRDGPAEKSAAAAPTVAIVQASPVSTPGPIPAAPRTRIWTWVAAGAAVVALGGGIAFGQESKSSANSLRDSEHTGAQVESIDSDVKAEATRGNVLLGIGVGLVAVTAALFVLHF